MIIRSSYDVIERERARRESEERERVRKERGERERARRDGASESEE